MTLTEIAVAIQRIDQEIGKLDTNDRERWRQLRWERRLLVRGLRARRGAR